LRFQGRDTVDFYAQILAFDMRGNRDIPSIEV
jgi:hypothetical protein